MIERTNVREIEVRKAEIYREKNGEKKERERESELARAREKRERAREQRER